MDIKLLHRYLRGGGAVQIADGLEAAIADGALVPGERLPTVRALAAQLGVSPTTVSAAFAALKRRGLLVTGGRRGSAVSQRPPLPVPVGPEPPPRGVRDLAVGNPSAELLPDLAPALRRVDASQRLYGDEAADPALLRLARRSFEADGIPGEHLAVTSGALDGIERVLAAHLRPGDRVAVEDPAFPGVLHLLAAMGLAAVPVAVDDAGPKPQALRAALRDGVQALVVTPRAQNPFGSALDPERSDALRALLRRHPDVIAVEDDHAGEVAGAAAGTLCSDPPERFAVVRSVSKAYGPDLRLAVLAGDPVTVARVEGRQLVSMRWVSFLLQRLVVALWMDTALRRSLREAARTYTRRRRALVDALAARGIEAFGRSGLNVWVPVPDEARVLRALLQRGFAVAPGERFRLRTGPAVRVTISTLAEGDAPAVAEAIALGLRRSGRTLAA
jgi:DNA-binding transcriptional MocR family regulator